MTAVLTRPHKHSSSYARLTLQQHIISQSVATSWDDARIEWSLIFMCVCKSHCPCGKNIVNQCWIENNLNGNHTFVGNICIEKFMEIATGKVHAGIHNILNDNLATVNSDLIDYLVKLGIVSPIEQYFLIKKKSYRLKNGTRKLKVKNINARIVRAMVNPRNKLKAQ